MLALSLGCNPSRVPQSDDGAPSYSGQREPRSNNRPMNRARMEEMAAILSNQDLAENDLMGAIKIIKADSDDTAEEVGTRAVLREAAVLQTQPCNAAIVGVQQRGVHLQPEA